MHAGALLHAASPGSGPHADRDPDTRWPLVWSSWTVIAGDYDAKGAPSAVRLDELHTVPTSRIERHAGRLSAATRDALAAAVAAHHTT